MSDLYIETRLKAIKDIASTSCSDEKDADNIASFCDEIYSAIEIVKQNDVCEWKSTQINNEWKPSCEPNSTYNVFGVAWFKRCPYCGKKIKW